MVEPLRVTHIISSLNVGGAEMMLLKLLSLFDDQRIKSHVITLMTGGSIQEKIEDLGIAVHSLGLRKNTPSIALISRLRDIMKANEPAIVQGWMYHGNVAAWLAAKMNPLRPPVAWNVRHSLYDIDLEKFLTRQVIRINRKLSDVPQAIIYNSRLARQQHEQYGFCTGSGVVIANGFQLDEYVFDNAAKEEVRSAIKVPREALLIGHIARYHPMKDHAGFIKAAVRLSTQHPMVRFVLAGRNVAESNRALLDAIPDANRGQFVFLGERNDVSKLLSAMDVFVSSSAYGEGFSNILGEAMSARVPCVATDVGESAEIIGNTGIVVSAKNPDVLYDAMHRLVELPDEERKRLGEKARKRIEDHFALPRIVEQYSSLYEKLGSGVSSP